MPHLTLEYSANLPQEVQAGALFSELFGILVRVAGLDIENCKGRIVRRDQVTIGRGEPEDAFVHLEVRLLAGRSTEEKGAIGRGCIAFLERYFSPSAAGHALQITVEIVDMQREAYFKVSR